MIHSSGTSSHEDSTKALFSRKIAIDSVKSKSSFTRLDTGPARSLTARLQFDTNGLTFHNLLFVYWDASVSDLSHTPSVSATLSRPIHDSRFEVNFSDAVHASLPLRICGKGLLPR